MRGEEHGSGHRNKGHTKAGWGESKMCAGKPESDLHNKNETGGAKRTLPVAAYLSGDFCAPGEARRQARQW